MDSPERPIVGEDITTAALGEATVWAETYAELVVFEEDLLKRARQGMRFLSASARREAEATNLPTLEGDLQRFRYRLDLWTERLTQLGHPSGRGQPTAG